MLYKGLEPGLTKALRLAPLSNYHHVIILPLLMQYLSAKTHHKINNYVRRISSQRTPPKEDKQMDKRTQRSDESIYMAILKLSHLLNKNQVYNSPTNRKKYTRSNKKHQNSEEAQNTFPTNPQFPAVIPWITRYQPKPNKPFS